MKHILTTLVLLVATAAAWAQPAQGTFSLLPRVGVSLSRLSGDAIYFTDGLEAKSKMKAGMMAGVDAEYQALPSLSVSLGAYYSEQGCKYKEAMETYLPYVPKNTGYSNLQTNLKYINVPVMLNAYVAHNLAVKAGVQLGFNIDGKMSYTSTDFTKADDGTVTYEKPVNNKLDANARKVDVAIPVGLQYEYMNVVIDARYNFGLTRVYDVEIGDKTHNNVLTISAAYRFTL